MEAAYATHRPGEPDSPFDSPVVLRSSHDLLAAVPYLLGFRPRECCVVVGVTGTGRLGFVARTALTELEGAGTDVRAVARSAGRVGVRLVLVVLYTAARPARARGRAAAVVGALDDVLGAGVDVETWVVTPDGYRGLDCSDAGCCPPGGRSLDELEHGEVGAAFVVSGRSIAPSEREAHQVRRLPDRVRDGVAKSAGRAERARAAACEDLAGADALAAGRWRAEAYEVWRDLMRQAAAEVRAGMAGELPLPPARLGRLAVALADVAVRDAVLLSLVPGGQDAADRTVRARGGDRGDLGGSGGIDAGEASDQDVEVATARAIARVVDPRVGVPPDAVTAEAARLVLEQVVGGAPRRWHAPALALLGFLAWWQGDGWLAGSRVREAVRRDPAHRLAALLAGVLQAAVPPGWVNATDAGGTAGVMGPDVG